MKKIKILLSSLFLLLILFVGTGVTKNLFNLSEPIYLLLVAGVKDGGSTEIILRGLEDKKFYILIDHRIDTKTAGRMYIGSDSYPNDSENLVSTNSDEEKQVLDTLQQIVDNNINPEIQSKLLKFFAENELKNLSFDDPNMVFIKNLPFEDMKAALLLQAIQTYKNTFHH